MQGAYLEPSKVTIAEFLEKWLGQIEPRVAPRTLERYQEIARKNIVPLLGQTILTKLRPDQIATAYAKALKSERRDGSGRPLATDCAPHASRPESGPGNRRALEVAVAQSCR